MNGQLSMQFGGLSIPFPVNVCIVSNIAVEFRHQSKCFDGVATVKFWDSQDKNKSTVMNQMPNWKALNYSLWH